MESTGNHISLPNTAPVLNLFLHSKPNYMNSNLILKSDILDILFEKRNKAYGAYVLRKLYPARLRSSLGMMLIVAALFAAVSLLPAERTAVNGKIFVYEDPNPTKLDQPKPDIPKKPESPKPPDAPKTPAVAANTAMLIDKFTIVSDNVRTDSIRTIDDNTNIGNVNNVDPGQGPGVVQPAVVNPAGTGTEPVKVDRTMPIGLGEADVPPSFPGGTEALLNFLRKHLNNPEPMTEGESVSVKVTFVVGYEGKLQGFKITQDGGEVFNKEVIRVLKKMPDWIPGKAKGENVSVYYSIPVKFTGAD